MHEPDIRTDHGAGLIRQLGLFDTTMLIMGIVIGSGIFLTTGLMAADIPSASLILLAWLIGGLHVLTGALTYAELGAAIPTAGGQYVYLREAYGPFAGFLFGWISFLAYLTGIIAALGVAFAEYFGYFFPAVSTQRVLLNVDTGLFGYTYTLTMGQIVAVILIGVLSAFNYIGVPFGKIIQNVTTVVKIGGISGFIALGILFDTGAAVDWSFNPAGMAFDRLIAGFGVALISVAWATAGWEEVSFVAGEIKNPGRNIPLALLIGTASITVMYLLVNLIYVRTLPVGAMMGVVRVGEAASAVAVSVAGAMNGTILVGPRVYYAIALDGLFFKRVARVHPRYHTPGTAIVLQTVWASVLALSGTFEDLITFTTFANLILWIGGAAAVFTLRKKLPDLPRPYKTWGYPVVPIVFIASSACIVINMLFETPDEAFAGLVFIAMGFPVYYAWRRRSQNTPPAR